MRKLNSFAIWTVTLILLASPMLRAAEDDKKAEKALDTLKSLAGTWVSEKPGQDGKPMTVIFKVTSGGTVVQETMFPGSDHEMVNMYAVDGDKLVLTHYCMMGNQPRMKLKTNEKGTMSFTYVDGGNLKSRDEAHMDSVDLKIDGDKLSEKWTSLSDGKTGEVVTFDFKRKS